MKIKNYLVSQFLVLFFLFSATSSTQAAEPYPLEYWALRDVMSNVSVSPDGKKLAALINPSRDGNPVLKVFNASNLDEKPFVLNADPMEAVGYGWVGNDHLVISFRQKVRDKIDGFNRGVYEGKIGLLDLKKKKIKEFYESNPRVVNLLVKKPGKVIIAFQPDEQGKSGVNPGFRPLSYYELDLKSGRKKLLIRGNLKVAQISFNGEGRAWTARGFDVSKGEFIWYYRKEGSSKWEELYRLSEDSFESFSVVGIDHIKPNTFFVRAENGSNTAGLWEFNTKTKAFGELVYARKDVNVAGVTRHTNNWTNPDTVTGVAYRTDKIHRVFFDQNEEALYKQLEGLIPYAHDISVTSRSKDGNTLTAYNVGPHDPGSYHLIKDGKMVKVGSKQPLLKGEDLADVKYINYKARDGRTIYAFITIPHGKGPFPTIVMPHGGPFISEVVGYDEWAQMLANNGYLVLQPQYRGSTNFGLEYYKSAFLPTGQGGFKMQDDKDDGVLDLVRQGLADKDRVAMFGWSYGGYAALIAASRTPQLYQCVLAGAAVSDALMQVSYYRARMRGAQKEEQVNMWSGSISPMNEIAKVNVPILLIHGSVDQRVPPEHVRKYLKGLKDHNKPYKYVELDGADHFSSTLFYDHQILLYNSMIDYLRDDCGPNGL